MFLVFARSRAGAGCKASVFRAYRCCEIGSVLLQGEAPLGGDRRALQVGFKEACYETYAI